MTNSLRLDNIPMDRRTAGVDRKVYPGGTSLTGPKGLAAVFEKRDVDPDSPVFARRTGSKRLTNVIPNVPGVSKLKVDAGKVRVAHDFIAGGEIASGTSAVWSFAATIKISEPSDTTQTTYFPIASFNGAHLYVGWLPSDSGNEVRAYIVDSAGDTSESIKVDDNASTDSSAGSYHICMVRSASGTAKIGLATKDSTDSDDYTLVVCNDGDATFTFENTNGQLDLFGTGREDDPPAGAFGNNVVIANAQLWKTAFSGGAVVKSAVTDTTPATSAPYELIWHQLFDQGGDAHSFINVTANPDETYYDYLTPTMPYAESTDIHFGGRGIAELPFYTDFDDYYYTPQSSSARVNWHFYSEFTTPHAFTDPGSDGTDAHVLFDFQDICKLVIYRQASSTYRLKAYYANSGSLVDTNHANNNLAASTTYAVHVGRDDTSYYIRLTKANGAQATKATGAAEFPALYDYTTTLSYIVGDTISQQNTLPFDGKFQVLGFWNTADETIINPAGISVFYYNATSVVGNELRDKGNRELLAFLGIRATYTTPIYKEGPNSDGSYVAATSGYYMTSFLPAPGYTGSVKKAITKDAVVQRIGESSFLVSNGEVYYINDEDKTFRGLGVPRPSSKVSCNAVGVGNIDGAVRYAYRYITKEGTSSPPYMLDAIASPGGKRVVLGAQEYGLPGDSPFGASWLRCEGVDVGRGSGEGSTNTNEWAAVYDKQETSSGRILYGDTDDYAPEGLTSEVCFRLPNKARVRESIFEQGLSQKAGSANKNIGVRCPYEINDVWQNSKEFTHQIAFRYDSGRAHQTLSFVGQRDQHYEDGNFLNHNNHYRTAPMHISIQPSKVANFDYGSSGGGYEDGNTSLVVCRAQKYMGRNGEYYATSFDYPFENGHDYVVIVRKGRIAATADPGNDLIVHIFDKQYHGNSDAKYALSDGSANGWCKWSEAPSVSAAGVKQAEVAGFFNRDNFKGEGGPGPNTVFTGMHGTQNPSIQTMVRASPGGSLLYSYGIGMFYSAATSDAVGDGILYHSRWWKKDFAPGEVALHILNPSLDGETGIFERYAGDSHTYGDELTQDLAFCTDAHQDLRSNAWCRSRQVNTYPFYLNHRTTQSLAPVFQTSKYTPIMSWGYDPIIADTRTLNSEQNRTTTPLGIYYSSRNEGSLIVFTGDQMGVEIATKRWYTGEDPDRMETLLFEDFIASNGAVINLSNFTWITLFFAHLGNTDPATSTVYNSLWLKRVYLDGTEVVDFLKTAQNFQGIGANAVDPTGGNDAVLDAKMMATLGGAVNMHSQETVDIAEFRVWNGDYYISQSGPGTNQFRHIGMRVPPTSWDDMWYYLRFAKGDANDAGSLMDNKGQYKETGTGALGGNERQLQADSVGLHNGAAIIDNGDVGDSGNTTTTNFIPFPSADISGIRGIQIFRTQIAPFTDVDPYTGEPTPSSLEDSIRAVRSAPLFFLDEIPLGTEFYEDNMPDALLGEQLDVTKAEVIPDPGGVVEWEGHLGIWSTTIPRIYWSRVDDHESFPASYRQELALRESGPVTAAVELGSRDARQSRVFVCGKSWAAFIDGNPSNPQMNTIGGGVGSASSRTLVSMNGIAYTYNGSLWAVTGDGQVADIGKSVQDLLPATTNARLSVSSKLASLFVIDESTGLCLRFHFPSQEWSVEDRYAMSVTDVDGVDTWVQVSGWPAQGDTSVYADDVESDTPTSVVVSSYDNAANTFVVASATGLKVGQRLTLIGDRGDGSTTAKPDARIRQTITITAIAGTTISTTSLSLAVSTGGLNYRYTAYPGIGYWGTMLDSGQFNFKGTLDSADIGILAGDNWWAAFDSADFPKKPTNRDAFTGVTTTESFPTNIVNSAGNGTAGRWGLTNRQRIQRILVWANKPVASELSEVELNYRNT